VKPRERPAPPVPERLARFAASEWPDDDGLSCWLRARLDFVKEHPGTPLGDEYDAFAEAHRLRRELPGKRQSAQFRHPDKKTWRRDGDTD